MNPLPLAIITTFLPGSEAAVEITMVLGRLSTIRAPGVSWEVQASGKLGKTI